MEEILLVDWGQVGMGTGASKWQKRNGGKVWGEMNGIGGHLVGPGLSGVRKIEHA